MFTLHDILKYINEEYKNARYEYNGLKSYLTKMKMYRLSIEYIESGVYYENY